MIYKLSVSEFKQRQGRRTIALRPMDIDIDTVIAVCPISQTLRASGLAPVLSYLAIITKDAEHVRLFYSTNNSYQTGGWTTSNTEMGRFLRACHECNKLRPEELTPQDIAEDGFVLVKDQYSHGQFLKMRPGS